MQFPPSLWCGAARSVAPERALGGGRTATGGRREHAAAPVIVRRAPPPRPGSGLVDVTSGAGGAPNSDRRPAGSPSGMRCRTRKDAVAGKDDDDRVQVTGIWFAHAAGTDIIAALRAR